MDNKKAKFVWLTIAGFLSGIGCGVILSVVAAATACRKQISWFL